MDKSGILLLCGSQPQSSIARLAYDTIWGLLSLKHGQVHFGADAIHAIALLSTRNNLFNEFASTLFASNKSSRFALVPTSGTQPRARAPWTE